MYDDIMYVCLCIAYIYICVYIYIYMYTCCTVMNSIYVSLFFETAQVFADCLKVSS